MSSNKEILGLHRITKEHLKDLCKKHRLYQTPHLNDQLYLHYQGFQAIENLEEYTGLKCLWLESNAISEIRGLQCLKELKCLFLQNNLIRKIEHLEGCSGLDTLNLASNHITKIENCGVNALPVLSTLNLSRNQIQSSDGLKELVNCKSLWSLDLSHNRIDDILVVKIFASMPELRVLVLQGNPVVNRVPQYRKTLILECKNLTYLDSRPVFPKDRACAEAWKRGGYEEERKEHERWNRKDRRKIRDSVNATLRLRRKNGDKEVELLPSTDDEDEEKRRDPNELKTMQVASADLEITGMKAESDYVALEIKGEEDGQMMDDSFTSSPTMSHDVFESKGSKGSQIITAEEMVDVVSSPTDEVVVQDLAEEFGKKGVDEQAEDAPTLIDHDIVCEEEEDLVTQSLTTSVLKNAASTERSANDDSSDTSSSSSEVSSDSFSVDSDAECDEDDDSLTKEDLWMEEVPKEAIENKTASVPPQQAMPVIESEEEKDIAERGPQGASNPSDTGASCNNSMSFDELVESQSFSYMETLSEQRSRNVMTTTKIGRDETIAMSDEEDSGLNSFPTESLFSEIDNHDDATLTCETPTNLGPTESSQDGTLYQEPEKHPINPEEIDIPDDVEVNVWLKNFLAGLKAEQDRDHDDTSSITDSSLEDCSDGDIGDRSMSPLADLEASTASARAATVSDEDKFENVLDSIAEGEVWLKSVLTSPKTEERASKIEECTPTAEEPTQSKGLAEATDLLASILAETQLKMDETTFPSSPKSSDDDDDDDSYAELSSSALPVFTSTLRDGLDSFNKVVESINKRREERLQKINDFVNHPLTKADAFQTEAQLDQQIEQIKQEKHERVRQLVEHVYAQKDEYDDTLEVIEGRLMVVKRGTGALEEVRPPPSLGGTQTSSRYITHGVSTNSVGEVVPSNQGVSATPHEVMGNPISPPHSSCGVSTAKSSESDDYGTPLSGDEHDDEDEEVEQHQSDTKISRITFPSMVNEVDSLQISATRTSACWQDEVSFEEHFREEQGESLQRVMELHSKIDAEVFAEVSKWMDEGGDIPSVSPAVKRGMGREEVMLLKQQVKAERAAEDALEDVARIFEIPSD